MSPLHLERDRPVNVGDIWAAVIDRASSQPFGHTVHISERRRAAEALAARLSGSENSAALAFGRGAQATWWRMGVAEWRRSGASQTLRECLATKKVTLDASAGARHPSRLPWLWSERETDPLFARAFRRGVGRTFELDLDGGWQGGPVSASETDLGESLRAATVAGWLQLADRVPRLLGTLSEHVGCVAWLDLRATDTTFRSGTTPDLPGVVLLSSDEAKADLYLPRAMVHEAAHCKFFDLCVSRDLVRPLPPEDDPVSARFTLAIPWILATSKRAAYWPLDQVLAAAHSYLHLMLLAGAWYGTEEDRHEDVTTSIWPAAFQESSERLEYLLRGLEATPLGSLGADGMDFVRWMRRLLRLARAVDHMLKGWDGSGPPLSVTEGWETVQEEKLDGGLLGRSGAPDILWTSALTVSLVRTGAGSTIGELAVTRLNAGAESAAEALVQIIDALTPLLELGVVTLG